MQIPIEIFVSRIEERNVYYFATTLIGSPEPHYFICLTSPLGGMIYLACCTSQFDSVERIIIANDFPSETLVYVNPKDAGEDMKLTLKTYINCNEVHELTLSELESLIKAGKITSAGRLSEGYFEQILVGIQASPAIEDEIKELIPKTQITHS